MRTARLLLIPASSAALRAELESPEALGRVLDVEVPTTWPPEFYDADAIRWVLDWLERNPDAAEWSMYYIAEAPPTGEDLPRLAGAGGYKGAPDDSGTVEIGYGIVADRRRRGYASEAVYGLLARAFADPRVTRVIAHTLAELAGSIGVLRTTGFEFIGAGSDPHEPNAICFELPRARYESTMATRVRQPVAGAALPPSGV